MLALSVRRVWIGYLAIQLLLRRIVFFTINTVFIAFAALLVCQYLKFPIRSIVDPDRKKRVNQALSAVMLITAIPSVYFGYQHCRTKNLASTPKILSVKFR